MELQNISKRAYLSDPMVIELALTGWEKAVEVAFEDGVLTEQEEGALVKLKDHFGLSQSHLDKKGAYSRVVKGGILRDLMEGKLPERIDIQGHLPFNFQKQERLIWVFQDVDYFEEKKRREYVGGSQGISVRIAKGVYYCTSAFRGRAVDRLETVHMASGIMAITNKHIYFSGGNKSFRIRHYKIVSFQPYSDGVGVQRDAQTARHQTLLTGDGWFSYNLLQNAANL